MISMETTEEIATSSIIYTLWKGDVIHRTGMSFEYDTTEWYFNDAETKTTIRAYRDKNEIRLTGVVGTQNIEENYVVNFDPWYQLMEPAIRHFAFSKKNEQGFWIINPETLTKHHLMANNKEYMSIKQGDDMVPAVQLTVTFSDAMSAMWKATYWYNMNDGSFIDYQTDSQSPAVESVRIVPMYY